MEGESATEISGFLYRAEDGRIILSDQPNLKSCCIGVKKGQITCVGEFAELPLSRVTLRGELKGDVLESATLVQESGGIPWISLGMALGLIFLIIRRSVRRARSVGREISSQ